MKKIKTIAFYFILYSPITGIVTLALFLLFKTDLPQTIYMSSIRNIYFDCLEFVDENYLYKAKPEVCELNNIEYNTILSHDQHGFRNKDTSSLADIILIGDSHTHGVGVNDDQTFASILKNKYGHKTKNLGIGSYATKRELEALQAYSNGEQIVVIQYCNNDFAENISSLELDLQEFKSRVKTGWKIIAENYSTQKAQGFSVPLNDFANRLYAHQYKSKKAFYADVYNRDIKREADVFGKILSGYPKILSGKKVIIFESSGHGANHPEFKKEFDTSIKKHSPDLNFVVLDSHSFLTNSDYYFLDDHLNKKGHDHIAEQLQSILER